jgi:hypothetical protein
MCGVKNVKIPNAIDGHCLACLAHEKHSFAWHVPPTISSTCGVKNVKIPSAIKDIPHMGCLAHEKHSFARHAPLSISLMSQTGDASIQGALSKQALLRPHQEEPNFAGTARHATSSM